MTKMKTQHAFSNVPSADIPRSSFNLSYGHKTTFDADFIIPVFGPIDVIPGDTFNVRASFFMRLATPVFPIMDNMYADMHFFFVPYRTIWTNFEKFHGAQDDPGASIAFTIPVLGTTGTLGTGDLGDYMGLPLSIDLAVTTDISAMPFRAYRKIWNEWYRDENLQNSESFNVDNGPDLPGASGWTAAPLKRGKRFDYFTSCLPSPQKGTAVSLPLGTSAPVTGIGILQTDTFPTADLVVDETDNTGQTYLFATTSALDGDIIVMEEDPLNLEHPNIRVDLSSATASTINEIRLAFQTQRLLERDARSGTRYVETLKAHWGVTSPDHRLQRAEFLGGGTSGVNVTPVAQTSGQPTPAAEDKLGNLAGFGTVSGTHSFSKSFVEHGVILGLVNVRGDITYSQGLDRYWRKQTRFDFYYPVLSGIGEQSVLNSEIWHNVAGTNNDSIFGYQERYAEYRFQQNRLSGLMRPDATSTLEVWHLSEDFSALPTLGDTFITANLGVPLDRAIAINTEPHFIADFFFDIKAARPMPTYGIPGNLDRL